MRALAGIMVAAVGLSACGGSDEIMVMGGSLELNQRLRHDMAASNGVMGGRFFASGDCRGLSSQDECHFVSAVQGSMVNALDASFTNRLRRAPFLWVEGDGFSQVSYEFVGRGITIVLKEDPTEAIVSDADVGSCHGFPVSNPDTRIPFEAFEDFDEEAASAYTQMFEVSVQECTGNGAQEDPGVLQPQTAVCIRRTVSDILNGAARRAPQNPPLCLVDLGVSALTTDVSLSLIPGTRPGVTLSDVWSGISVTPFLLEPHLKVVPIVGTRTISRLMERTGTRRTNDDGSITHFFAWRVPADATRWSENFSPNVVVQRARVRRGPWSPGNQDYLDLEALEVGNVSCQVRMPNSGGTEFDIPMCNPNMQGAFRVTPGYRFEAISQGRVDDGDRLLWDARVNVPRETLSDDDELYLELDLTALAPIGSSGAGLMADPGGRNLGTIRTGATAGPQPGFMLHNIGSVSAYVQSITFTGPNAAEFGAVQVQRVSAPGTGSASAAPVTITPPFIFLAGSRAEVKIVPAFQTIGPKQAFAVITYRDVRNTTETIQVALQANAVTPLMNVLPATVYFYATPGPTGHAQAQRAALLTNDGPLPFQRTGLTIEGPDAASFRLLRAEYGPGASDPSQPLTVESGAAEIYRMGYYPTGTGIRTATLRIDTNEGQLTIALNGACDEGCTQPPPPPPLIDQKPVVPPEGIKITYPKVKLRKDKIKKLERASD